jgi:hypothetical protein
MAMTDFFPYRDRGDKNQKGWEVVSFSNSFTASRGTWLAASFSAFYGLHFLHGSYPIDMASSLVPENSCLFFSFICFTLPQVG